MDRKPPSPSDSRTAQDFDPWGSPSADFPDHWADPVDERSVLRRRIGRNYLGFTILGLALLIASLTDVGDILFLLFSDIRQPLHIALGIPHFELIVESAVVWTSLLGACFLWGRWPDVNWQRRSGLFLMMCIADAILWAFDHAVDLGLHEGKFPHEWFRSSLGTALGWSEFALIASLAADKAAHLGEAQAADFSKAVRSLTTTGAMVWFMYFYTRTSWKPFWPLQPKPLNPGTWMIYLSWIVLHTIVLVQVTLLTLLAGRCCARAIREMAEQDRRDDLLPSRSEVGWEELNRPGGSGPNGRP